MRDVQGMLRATPEQFHAFQQDYTNLA